MDSTKAVIIELENCLDDKEGKDPCTHCGRFVVGESMYTCRSLAEDILCELKGAYEAKRLARDCNFLKLKGVTDEEFMENIGLYADRLANDRDALVAMLYNYDALMRGEENAGKGVPFFCQCCCQGEVQR